MSLKKRFSKVAKKKIIDILNDSIKVKEEIKKEKYLNTVLKIVEEIISCLKRDGKVILFGNGGSAADAQHIAAELMGRFQLNRRALPAIALTTNTSVITALSNDYSYDIIFAKQLEGLARKGDIAIGISTSGKAENVILGIKKAKEMGLKTIAFTGGGGGSLAKEARISIIVSSKNTPRIQETHITIGHIVCELVEEILFKKSKS